MTQLNQPSSSKLKHIVFVLFFLVLFVPMLQQLFHVVKEEDLIGVDNAIEHPSLALDIILTGDFQKRLEAALDVNTGFRKTFVRLYNHLNYSIYNISKVGGVIVGENGFLYISSYTNAVNGKDFVGKEYIDLQVQKAIVIRNELKKKNIDLVFAFAPGKGSFHPEYMPSKLKENITVDSTNYVCYVNALSKTNINIIDLKKYFLSIKDTVRHNLFPKLGVHWGEYGAVLAIDTISKYIANMKKIKMQQFQIKNFDPRLDMGTGDYDAAGIMNLLSVLPHEELPYVKISYSKDSAILKPKLLTIADSYFHTIELTNILDSLYSNRKYLLYYKKLIPNKDSFNLKNELENYDVILLLATDATLGSFPYGFIDDAYEEYAPKTSAYYSLKNKEFRLFVINAYNNIQKSKKWKQQLQKSAKKNNISELDEYINNILWLYKTR